MNKATDKPNKVVKIIKYFYDMIEKFKKAPKGRKCQALGLF